MLLFDPAPKTTRQSAVGFLAALVRSVGPAIYNVYLTTRLRTRAGAIERARVARELHDGVIQSLISLEMQIDVLRRAEGATPEHVAAELQRIQSLIRQEVLNLRELMQQMTPVNIAPKHLLEFLAYTVDKFRRDTGITATFTSAVNEVALPPRVCTEVARILQEALANIRKHSGARNVLVRLDSAEGLCKLIVDDDGQGFDFSGRLTQDDLDISRRGPMVIKERVRSIDGTLAIDSNPGGGARLEITFPQRTDA
jgi:two-component system sensor histidine kinase DegS